MDVFTTIWVSFGYVLIISAGALLAWMLCEFLQRFIKAFITKNELISALLAGGFVLFVAWIALGIVLFNR